VRFIMDGRSIGRGARVTGMGDEDGGLDSEGDENRLITSSSLKEAMGRRISVIIPTKNRTDHLAALLASLRAQTRPVDELILVDDSDEEGFSSNAALLAGLTDELPELTILHLAGRHIGSADARNQGVDRATGGIISFLDDDVVLDPNYYLHLERTMGGDDVAGATGAIINFPESLGWELFSRAFFLSNHSRRKGYMTRSGYPCFMFNSDVRTPVEVMSGCNMNFRREVLLPHHFDSLLLGYSYMEDSDLSYRVSREHRLIFEPECRLMHNNDDRAVNGGFYRTKMAHHRYLFKKNIEQTPLNRIAYSISVLGDLVLVTERALRRRDPELITAALGGLSLRIDGNVRDKPRSQ